MPQNNEEQVQLSRLLAIIEQLRDPETGCPWDQKQSFESNESLEKQSFENYESHENQGFENLEGKNLAGQNILRSSIRY